MRTVPKDCLLLVSMVQPRNECGVRIVMHRNLVERDPFNLHVVSHAEPADDLLIQIKRKLPTHSNAHGSPGLGRF
jgi:hypothetical protein